MIYRPVRYVRLVPLHMSELFWVLQITFSNDEFADLFQFSRISPLGMFRLNIFETVNPQPFSIRDNFLYARFCMYTVLFQCHEEHQCPIRSHGRICHV
jgi:hypothetical protein